MISIRKTQAYCCEDISHIENYDKAIADSDNQWDCHHRRESIYSRKGLIEIGEYYNRPAAELIFLKHDEHISRHKAGTMHHMYGKHHTAETCNKMSKAHKGKHLCEQHKTHISEATKAAMSNPEVKKKLSEAKKGRPSPRKGVKLSQETKDKIRNANIGKKHTAETRAKMSASRKRYLNQQKTN